MYTEQSMKFGILGYGYVGKATHLGILNNQSCVVHDILFQSTKDDLKECETIFVCIPTATDQDIDILINEIKDLKAINKDALFIIRSTLPIGTCKRIQEETASDIIYIPEFLRERFWDTDCLRRPLIVGNDNAKIPQWLRDESIVVCKTVEAEMVKMFNNNFASVRIAFANVFYDLSQKLSADYDLVKEMFFKIQPDQTYMEVPGHDGGRGFSGKCLPKDLDFLIDTLDKYQIDQNWFKHIRTLNDKWTDDQRKV